MLNTLKTNPIQNYKSNKLTLNNKLLPLNNNNIPIFFSDPNLSSFIKIDSPSNNQNINPEMRDYILKSTNKSINNYLENQKEKIEKEKEINTIITKEVNDYALTTTPKIFQPIVVYPKSLKIEKKVEWLITGISIISFFAGYYFRRLINKNK